MYLRIKKNSFCDIRKKKIRKKLAENALAFLLENLTDFKCAFGIRKQN